MKKRCIGALLLALGAGGCSSDPIGVAPVGQPPLGDALPTDEQLALPGLVDWVDAVRDGDGRMHVYARNVHDAMLVQGYLVARDRHVQLDLLRRIASGRLAEVLGALDPSVIETDISFRHIGLHRVAARMLEEASPEEREALEAYAAGVSLLFAELRDGRRSLPEGINVFEPKHLTPWTPVDSLTVGRLQTWLLSYGADEEIAATALLTDLKTTFHAADPDPLIQKRAGMERDFLRFEPPSHASTLPGLDEVGPPPIDGPAPAAPEPDKHLFQAAERHAAALARVRRWLAPPGDFGSNNWAVDPSRSASGFAMLASDPHLSLSSPAVFWPLSLHVAHDPPNDQDLDVGGIAFPGIPGIILGHNERLAWGATVAYHDVTDVYLETLTADGEGVIFEGQEVPLETVEERIDDGRGGELVYEVKIVPHHGPIFPTVVDGKVVAPEGTALSVRWTGLEPTDELGAVLGLHRAADVDEAIASLQRFGVGGQNWMLADTGGRIGWTTHARVPYRDDKALTWSPSTYEGLLPCLVLPGDGTAEWTGFWSDDAVPWDVDPTSGYLATANNDPVGGTFDNDPSDDTQADGTSAYLNCRYAAGFRQARIKERIEAETPLSLDDMSAIQGDHRSPLGSLLTPALLLAIENAEEEVFSGGHPDLSEVVADPAFDLARISAIAEDLVAWGAESDYAAAAGVDLATNEPLAADTPEGRAGRATLVFNTWLVRFLARTFADELDRVGRAGGTGDYVPALLHLMQTDPPELATYDPATGDSALWDDLDTPAVESRQERMLRALLDALTWLDAEAGAYEDWRWGTHHTVVFAPLLPVFGTYSIPSNVDAVFRHGFPRHGDMFVVDASNYDVSRGLGDDPSFGYGSGPTQRFVVELDPNGLVVRNALPGGAVFDRDSPHFADQAEVWRRNETLAIPFALDDVVAAAEARATFHP